MRRSRFHAQTHNLAELNITPLLDLVFVLLIIFMITTPLMEQQLPVDLPKATTTLTSTLPDPKSILTLTLGKDGSALLGSDKIDLNQLASLLSQRKARDPELVVSLRADASLPYETIFRALESVRTAGARLDLANTPDTRK
ncbi:MAG: biopolymer transporter ExbD [Verrucomicrobia bacterium]|jgi:biopolymer transport protein TolR|nr:biopolymer transporter ExbD [Verrucomicrobiota bacterium]MDA0858779.1 biopolymer transporter ExbD [Verrucomicrobiota bacterium]MDA1340692.1 biopolymer transporter ExbD [Verrucomicrobiota bacterium]